jgi:hypothetical protein
LFAWAGTLYGYLYDYVYPKPAQGAVYGYRWQAGQGVPGVLQQIVPDNAAPSLYVVFTGALLDHMTDPFGRAFGGPGPVFVAPGVVPPAVTNLVAAVVRNPPPGEAGWTNPAPGRLADIAGFLSYVDNCLTLLNATAAGSTLLTRLTGSGHTVFISPGLFGNQTFVANQDTAVDTLTKAMHDYAAGGPIPADAINAAVQAQYANVNGQLGKFNRLATDMNAAPLYSLFVRGTQFTQRYLYSFFRFRNQRLTGQNLQNWCSPGGFAAFDATVRNMTAPRPDGVAVRDMFVLALSVALYPSAPRGPGAGAGVKFFTQNANDNHPASPDFRPPAVGLAHELMHAMHYTRGSSPGYDIHHYSTTAAELMFAGIGPSATEPVNENAIRAQWGTIGIPIDPSNTWAVPVQRPTYEPPAPGMTAATMRAAMHCL